VRLLKQWNVTKIALVQTLEPTGRFYARQVIYEASKANITLLTSIRISIKDQGNVAGNKSDPNSVPNYELFRNHYNELKRVDAR
jgi:hypothetical protein